MKLTKFGHACVLIAEKDTKILFDPGIFTTDAIDYADLQAIIITHEHPDHFDFEKLRQILQQNIEVLVYTNTSVAASLHEFGNRIHAVRAGDTVQVGDFTLAIVGGEHARIFSTVEPIENIGVIVNNLLFVPGDSYFVPNQKPAWLALPLNAPWARLEETIQFAEAMQPQHVFAVHDGLLSEAGHQIYGRGRGMPAGATWHELKPGDTITLA